MFKNNSVFDKNKSSKSLKYFIITFALFILILSVISIIMFMKSIDFDIDNLTGKTTTEAVESSENIDSNNKSLSDLTGKSNILFLCENNNKLDFLCFVETDFNNGYMKVSSLDGDELVDKDKTLSDVYIETSVDGVNSVLNRMSGVTADKYIICNRKQFKDILSLFDNIQINVEKPVDYHSYEFNLELDTGKQVLSEDYLLKYLIISDNNTRSQIFCDILNSVLVLQYTENSQKLFTKFVNNCKTDISVIDYSEKIDDLVIYSKAEDRFFATVK